MSDSQTLTPAAQLAATNTIHFPNESTAYRAAPDLGAIRGTRWGALQAVTAYVDHVQPTRRTAARTHATRVRHSSGGGTIARGPGLIETYMRGYQGPAMNTAFMEAHRPGLKKGSTTKNGVPFDTYTYQ